MIGRFFLFFLVAIFHFPYLLHAYDLPYSIYVGPEIYHMRRWRDGGTVQTGRLDGLRCGIDKIQKYCFYYGFDALYAEGDLSGHTGSDFPLKSTIRDLTLEGRLGYALESISTRCPYFVPFAGFGYFNEINDFHSPSPIPFTFTDSFYYITTGFLSGINFTPLLSMGLNFKIRFMLNGRSRVTDDPFYEDLTLSMKEETHYRLEVPFICKLWYPNQNFKIGCVPFYEYRHFGGRVAYPFNFVDTKFSLFGARFAIILGF